MRHLVPTSSLIFGRPRPDLVPIMNLTGRGHRETAGHSVNDLVPILKATSSRPDAPSRDEVAPHLTSANTNATTSSHLVRDEVGTKSKRPRPSSPAL